VDVGAYLRAGRYVRGLSQRELARKAGVPRSTLDRIEAGRTDPRLSTLEKLFGVLGFGVVPANEHGRPLRIDPFRETLIDGRGRRFPPHWEYEPVTDRWDDRWWGHYRKSWTVPVPPKYTYWRRHPDRASPWDEAT